MGAGWAGFEGKKASGSRGKSGWGGGGNKEFAKISIFLGLFEYTTNGRELKFKMGEGKEVGLVCS